MAPARSSSALDIPGIDKERTRRTSSCTTSCSWCRRSAAVAAERERFVAYTLGETIEEFGTVVVPTAILQVVRAPRNGEAAIVQVVELYGMLERRGARSSHSTPLGAGATARRRSSRDAPHDDGPARSTRDAVLPVD